MNALPPQSDIYEFGEFRVDAVKRLLTKRGEVVPLAPKAFETLLYLARHPGELLEKEQMMRAIWADTTVEEKNLNQ
jgi:DNA-binding winged helix-turn-helix (wHTH) protein